MRLTQLFFCVALLLGADVVFAQSKINSYPIDHALSPTSEVSLPLRPAIGTYRVLAVMVDFQPDNSVRTTGDGTFGSVPYLRNPDGSVRDSIVDPLPHDANYFTGKLQFLRNYYRFVSDGRTDINFTLLTTPVRVSQPMASYSPPRRGTNFTRIANLAREVWRNVDSANAAIDFSQYDCFIIFHAGVGRDINLVALTGLDSGPGDLPSLTFSLRGFQRIYGDSFTGFPVDNGANFIRNTLIIPAAESREIDAVTGRTLIELSTNGLLCASFGAFLGLPDLFDTRTGRSVLGRFGLMDGAGFFSFNGLFPPEPSAWERIALGWAKPILVTGNAFLKLPAQGLHLNPDSVIYKLPISASEYFLLENRHRNPRNQGIRLTRFFRGAIDASLIFRADTSFFNADNISGFDGQLISASNYDWSLPSGLVDNRRYENGVLIWHIDETIINGARDTNGVNANAIKGVRLLEADGSNDIGQNYTILDAGNGTQNGWPLDFFFAGNPAPIYGNQLGDNTFPSLRANSGATTKLTIRRFPLPTPVMDSIEVQRGDNLIRIIPGFPKSIADSFTVRSSIATGVINLGDSLTRRFFVNAFSDSVYQVSRSNPVRGVSAVGRFKPAMDSLFLINVKDSILEVRSALQTRRINLGGIASTPAVRLIGQIAVGLTNGNVVTIRTDSLNLPPTVRTISSRKIISIHRGDIIVAEDKVKFPGLSPVTDFGGERAVSSAVKAPVQPLASPQPLPPGFYSASIVMASNKLLLLTEKDMRSVQLPVSSPVLSQPVLADLENRNELATLITAEDKIFAYNPRGFLITGFPISTFSAKPIVASPVIVDVDGDTFADIVVQTQDGRLMAFDRRGKNLFTMPVAPNSPSTPTVVPSIPELGVRNVALLSVDEGGFLQGFELPNATSNIEWGSLYNDNTNDATYTPIRTTARSTVTIDDFMPEKSVYNYPNPGNTETNFRFYLKENANVTVRVFDMTGQKVWEQSTQGVGGTDNEIKWTLGGVQSGVYYATVTASGTSTKTVKVKVAVAK
jgi:hypothetical protein